jgi:peptidoglycan/xylan/chitin deacetylase (PgdA/CDA1 family)
MIGIKVRGLCKTLAYQTGLLGGYHLVRNRRNLTIAMFHRVLAKRDPQWASADPNWTVSLDLFRDCLLFFRKHYNIIDLDRITKAQQSGITLPSRPLLITLDDGWADNAEHALETLKELRIPATVFIVAEAAVTGRIWDQFLYTLWRRDLLGQDEWNRLIRGVPGAPQPRKEDLRSTSIFRELLASLSALPKSERDLRLQSVSHLEKCVTHQRVLNPGQIRQLHEQGITIGSHGLTHALIPYTENPDLELTVSKQILGELLGGVEITALSFPHGVCDDRTIERAVGFGYRALFDSRPCLNRISSSLKSQNVLARINICAADISGSNGRLAPAELATLLFSRPVSVPS